MSQLHCIDAEKLHVNNFINAFIKIKSTDVLTTNINNPEAGQRFHTFNALTQHKRLNMSGQKE
jgi:hypothetical protein